MSGSAEAASYGDFSAGPGGGPLFLSVSDDRGEFGAPSLSADGFSLEFDAPTLRAECSDCPEGAPASERLNLIVGSDPPSVGFDSIQLSASVPYSVDSRGFPQDRSFAAFVAFADVRIRIIEDIGGPIDPIEGVYQIIFSPSNNVTALSGDQLKGTLEGLVDIDLGELLRRSGPRDFQGIVSRLELEIVFTLDVYQHSGGSLLDPPGFARGELSAFGIEVVRTRCLSCEPDPPIPPMPEPSSAVLIGLGLMGLATRRGAAVT